MIATLRQLQGNFAASRIRDAAYDIPYSTVHVGRMQGGTALNIVPDRAEIEFELRHLAADSLEDFEARLAKETAAISDPWRNRDPGGKRGNRADQHLSRL